jgi:hypothetical protein
LVHRRRVAAAADRVQAALPNARVCHIAADTVVACGATVDAGQVTESLPKELETTAIALTPYAIGVSLVGDVITILIPRGEPLPAIDKTRVETLHDSQQSVRLAVYQGDHYLRELSNLLGQTEVTDLPLGPRGQVSVEVVIEYDMDGILRFSAKETQTGRSVTARFISKTKFTDEDAVRLRAGSQMPIKEEMAIANPRCLMGMFTSDLAHAEGYHLKEDAQEWREWIADHADAPWRDIEVASHTANFRFHVIDPAHWPPPQRLRADLRFTLIWPREPLFISEGAAILRFLTAVDCRYGRASVKNRETEGTTSDFDNCQLQVEDRIETVMRVVFPAHGSYEVALVIAPSDVDVWNAGDLLYQFLACHFRVTGTPASNRPVCQFAMDRTFAPLHISSNVWTVYPSGSCVIIPSTTDRFVCNWEGKKLLIGGCQFAIAGGAVIFAVTTSRPDERDGCFIDDCTIDFPSAGIWSVFFYVDYERLAAQMVIAGDVSKLEPTNEEQAALIVVPP